MQYRRIHDLEPVDSFSNANLVQSKSPQDPRKRKLDTASHQRFRRQSPNAFHTWEGPGTYNEDEIHLFRRVHIKMRKPVDWSQENKHLAIENCPLDGHTLGAVIFGNQESLRLANTKAAAVHCNKPFDKAFCYFEIGVGYSNSGYNSHV